MKKHVFPNLCRLARRAMWLMLLVVSLLCARVVHAAGETARDYAVEVTATVQGSKPRITLNWTAPPSSSTASTTNVYRRAWGGGAMASWGNAVASLNGTTTTYADMTAAANTRYEYKIDRTITNSVGTGSSYGYVVAGYQVPLVDSRGRLLLIVDSSIASTLANELATLTQNLAGDGWTMVRQDVSRSATPAAVKAQIVALYNQDAANTKAILLVGHVPVPYSGNQNPDGHPDHLGAWPADGYYGDMDGVWTDSSVNNASNSLSDERNRNVPGDGKFDQLYYRDVVSPSVSNNAVDLSVGRIDLANMTLFPDASTTETDLLRRYLQRNASYRLSRGALNAVPRRAYISDNFGAFSGEAFAADGFRAGSAAFGSANITTGGWGNWMSTLNTNGYLIACGVGPGSFTNCDGIGSSANFGQTDSKAVFNLLFGSYFGDWDSTNNLLRAPLAGTAGGYSLASIWSGRPHMFVHALALGETIGDIVRANQNQSGFYQTGYTHGIYDGSFNQGMPIALMGDPTLRLHVVKPVTGVYATTSGSSVTVSWTASADTAIQGYHVYRANSVNGPFTRLTGATPSTADPAGSPISVTTFTDSTGTAGTAYTYQVRAVKLESSSSGSYMNASTGIMTTLTVGSATSAAPTGLSVTAQSATQQLLTWTDNANDETGFKVERDAGGTGNWTQIATPAANATSYTDSTVPASYPIYYRVRATNAAGDSDYSNIANDPATPGRVAFVATQTNVQKTVGTVTLSVQRSTGSLGAVSVAYATGNGSAIAGTDYTAASGTLSWANGDTANKTITVPITNVSGPQPDKTFTVTLSNPTGGVSLGATVSHTVTIQDYLTGTVFSSTPYDASLYPGSKAFDGDTTSFFAGANATNNYVGIDLGAGSVAVVTTVQFYPRSGFAGRMAGGVFQGSNDGSTYITLASVSGTPADNAWTTLAITDPNAYRYLRYYNASTQGDVAEIKFIGAAPQNAAAAPIFTPAAGTYSSTQNVTISTTTSGATIRYTNDGSTPTGSSGTLYAGPIAVSSTTTLKAIATKSGLADSAVSVAAYIFVAAPLTGTVFSSTPYDTSTYPASKAFDGDTSTFFASLNATNNWVGIDLGAGRSAVVNSIKFYPRSGYNSRVAGGVFQGSNDGTTYTQIAAVAGTPTNNAWTTVSVPGAAAYRYLRYYNANYGDIAELQFFSPPTAPSALGVAANGAGQLGLTWTDNAFNETGFKIERSLDGSTGWTQIGTSAADATQYIDTGLAAATTYYYRVRATNLSGDSAFTNIANATTRSLWQNWLASYGLPTDGSGNGADNADPDGDGIPNLLEYAFGGNPTSPSSAIQPTAAVSGGQLQIAFPCDSANSGITYTVQSSADLVSWFDIARSVGGTMTTAINSSGAMVSDSGSGARTVTVTNVSAGSAKSFLRIKVTRP